MSEAVFKVILEEHLNGRQFFIDPDLEGHTTDSFSRGTLQEYEYTTISISIEGARVPALTIPRMTTYHEGWKTYIPPSPEHDAIVAALKLENAEWRLTESAAVKEVSALRSAFEQQVAAVG